MAADDQPDEAESNKHLVTFINPEAPMIRIALVDVLNLSWLQPDGNQHV